MWKIAVIVILLLILAYFYPLFALAALILILSYASLDKTTAGGDMTAQYESYAKVALTPGVLSTMLKTYTDIQTRIRDELNNPKPEPNYDDENRRMQQSQIKYIARLINEAYLRAINIAIDRINELKTKTVYDEHDKVNAYNLYYDLNNRYYDETPITYSEIMTTIMIAMRAGHSDVIYRLSQANMHAGLYCLSQADYTKFTTFINKNKKQPDMIQANLDYEQYLGHKYDDQMPTTSEIISRRSTKSKEGKCALF